MFLTSKKPAPEMSTGDFDQTIARLDKEIYGADPYVTNVSTRAAMGQATVYACVRVISEIIAQLPMEVQQRQNGAWVNATNHRLKQVLAEPNDWQTCHDFISFLVSWSELRGNSYYYKVFNGAGEVSSLLPLEADEVSTDLYPDARVRYTVSTNYGINGVFDRTRVMHHRNFGIEGYQGLSTIGSHRRGIGLAVELEKHASNAYQNGMQSNKWLHLEEGLTNEQKRDLESFLSSFSGAKNNGKIPYFANAELKEFKGVSATDAQYIETRRMQKQDIAGLFGVPLFILNDTENSTTWGSGLEQISRAFVRFSLNPRLNRLKQTLHRELIRDGAKRETRIEFDTDQFTLGEFKDRMDGYRAGIESGVLNPNECRDLERRNPREGGDDYRQPANILVEGENEPEPNATEI